MKTIETILELYQSKTLDGRDITRLAQFLDVKDFEKIGLKLKEDAVHTPIPFTRENILNQLKLDVEFGFEKALDKRGISSSLMYSVVSMWNWILEEGLEDFDSYTHYGLPLFKATAIKYEFDNPIEDDEGDEYHYSAESDY